MELGGQHGRSCMHAAEVTNKGVVAVIGWTNLKQTRVLRLEMMLTKMCDDMQEEAREQLADYREIRVWGEWSFHGVDDELRKGEDQAEAV